MNGAGRIGRAFLRAALDRPRPFAIVAVNDLAPVDNLALLLRHDSTRGPWPGRIASGRGALEIDGTRIEVLCEADPGALPWRRLGVDLVIEATGVHRGRRPAERHLFAGAGRVIVTAPMTDADALVLLPFNHETAGNARIVSAGSCTAHSLVPLIDTIDRAFGWAGGHMTTVHPVTSDQRLVDGPHPDPRRGRSALAAGIIPTTSSAIDVVRRVMPRAGATLTGFAYRVPTATPAVTDLVARVHRPTTVGALREAFRAAARQLPPDVLGCSEEPLVGVDFAGRPHSATVDLTLATVPHHGVVHVAAWYDNESGYAHRLVDLVDHFANLPSPRKDRP